MASQPAAASSASASMPWTLRARNPPNAKGGGGAVVTLNLPMGDATTLNELVDMCCTALRVARARLVLKHGFPPRKLDAALLTPQQGAVTVKVAGLQNHDVLTVERAVEEEKNHAADGATPATEATTPPPSATTSKKSQRWKAPGAGQKLGSSPTTTTTTPTPETTTNGENASLKRSTPAAQQEPTKANKRVRWRATGTGNRLGTAAEAEEAAADAPEEQEEAPPPARPRASAAAAAAAAKRLDKAADLMLGGAPDSAYETARTVATVDILAAASGGAAFALDNSSASGAAGKRLRAAMRDMRAELEEENRAERRLASALAGRYETTRRMDGKLVVHFTAPGRRAAEEDVVLDIPTKEVLAALIAGALEAVAAEEDPGKKNDAAFAPRRLALASPATFWAVARHGGVGPTCTFADAMHSIKPGHDWDTLVNVGRKRNAPERYTA
ncbi:hypothetical protein PPROV_000677500 [Pycnococcus provasolii]|uniref:Uncharacterized protein n=1 Tax=Pycnococcus provasolii TaxID=41880 RepID=A0A830HMW6_9CHLO|nr:hypothetical protein PPROV_000677500 [Pycnococcus provasolii]